MKGWAQTLRTKLRGAFGRSAFPGALADVVTRLKRLELRLASGEAPDSSNCRLMRRELASTRPRPDLARSVRIRSIALPTDRKPALQALSAEPASSRKSEEEASLAEWLRCLREASASRPPAHARVGNLGASKATKLADDGFQLSCSIRRANSFSIGFNVTERRRDASFYDLLASEARLCSYVAIALGQVPQDHWFSLGRLLVASRGEPILVSWSGSMFEYLMPLLVMPNYENTLLDHTCKGARSSNKSSMGNCAACLGEFPNRVTTGPTFS